MLKELFLTMERRRKEKLKKKLQESMTKQDFVRLYRSKALR